VDWSATLQGLAGGILIGLSATWLMASLGRIAGISGIIGNLITLRPKGDSAWRVTFLLGLISGPIVLMLLGGGLGNVAGSGVDVTGAVIGAPRFHERDRPRQRAPVALADAPCQRGDIHGGLLSAPPGDAVVIRRRFSGPRSGCMSRGGMLG